MPTPILGLPYPVSSDTADVPRDIKALADKIDPLGVVPVGALMMWPTAIAPLAWLLCDGHQVLASDYPALAAVLGSQGGQITLPNLKDRFPMGAGATPVLGAGGANTVKLTAAQSGVPGHAHGASSGGASQSMDHLHAFTTNAGGDHAHGAGGFGYVISQHYVGWQQIRAGTGAIQTMLAQGAAWSGVANADIRAVTENGGTHQHTGGTGGIDRSLDHTHAITVNANAAADASTDHENRPAFLAVNYIIRAL